MFAVYSVFCASQDQRSREKTLEVSKQVFCWKHKISIALDTFVSLTLLAFFIISLLQLCGISSFSFVNTLGNGTLLKLCAGCLVAGVTIFIVDMAATAKRSISKKRVSIPLPEPIPRQQVSQPISTSTQIKSIIKKPLEAGSGLPNVPRGSESQPETSSPKRVMFSAENEIIP